MNETIFNFWQGLATGSIGIIVTLVAFWVVAVVSFIRIIFNNLLNSLHGSLLLFTK